MRLIIITSLFLITLLSGCSASGIPFPGTPGQTPPTLSKMPEFSAPPGFSEEEAVKLAKDDLSARLSISDEEITVISVESVNWPDTSIGLPEPDKVYAQVIVPGFKITLGALGQDYLYHAGWVSNKMVVILAVPRQGY
jgi:hypothetical protein